jgi:hypothetical protein
MQSGIRLHRPVPETSSFLRHFRVRAVPRLKLRQLHNASAGEAGLLRQPSGRLKRWPFVRCLAGSNAESAYEIDIKWRALGQLASAEGTNDIPHCND